MNNDFSFTSESVTPGHPDKIADQISDAILDEVLKQDTEGRVACETLVCGNRVVLAGEITTTASVNYEEVARSIIKEIGFDDPALGFDYESCKFYNFIGTQSPDISHGVNTGGACDQGIMFGYACDETPELMPLAISLAHKLSKRLVDARKNNIIKGLRPDGKVQVTILYRNGKPHRLEKVLISTQHCPEVNLNILTRELRQAVIKPVCFGNGQPITSKEILVNPTGRFVIGGPVGDCGMTGRKIIVDTYGGYSRHGGGAFCFSGDTLVKTVNGYSKIKDVKKGDLVWTVNEKYGNLKLKPIEEIISNSEEDSDNLLKITLDTGEIIKVTENHEVRIKEKGWIPIKDVKDTDDILEFKDYKIFKRKNNIEYWITAGFDLDSAYKRVSEEQRKISKICIEYWLEKGYTKKEGKEQIINIQKTRSMRSVDYWIHKNFTKEQAIKKVSEYQSTRLEGKNSEELKDIYSHTSGSLNNFIRKYGDLEGKQRYNLKAEKVSKNLKKFISKLSEEQRKEFYGRHDQNNGMFGCTPSLKSGNGISGIYKNKYVFRSLMELMVIIELEKEEVYFICNEDIQETQRLRINYKLNGKEGTYAPDILLLTENGDIKKVIEVKPKDFVSINKDKFKIIGQILNKDGIDFEILSDIKYDIKLLQILFKNNKLKISENKINRFEKFICR